MQTNENKNVWAIDPVHTRIRFEAKYLMITAVSGWFRDFEGTVVTSNADFNDSEIRLTIYTNSIFTGVDERDNHLRSPDFFDTKKYPTIYFRSTTVSVNDRTIAIAGVLTIKDIEQEISFTADYLGSVIDPMGNTKAGFEMDINFDRKDFNITWNQFFDKQGVLISDNVRVHCDIQLLKLS
jgi:polyisoprenoid-binding protein YceI